MRFLSRSINRRGLKNDRRVLKDRRAQKDREAMAQLLEERRSGAERRDGERDRRTSDATKTDQPRAAAKRQDYLVAKQIRDKNG
jgi:hypothetical protein